MSAPQVYKAISAISADLARSAIPKLHRNERDDYLYRSIDDVLNRLSPLLARHKLCVLPRVLKRASQDRAGEGDLLLVHVTLKVAFDLVSVVDGSSHTIETYGEALDPSDKATAKAMSSAYKHAVLHLFCVPVAQIEDADRSTHRLKRSRSHQREPVEGWTQWAAGMADIAASCASVDALERLQDRQRPLLTSISRERPDLYSAIGDAVAKRAAGLRTNAGRAPKPQTLRRKAFRSRSTCGCKPGGKTVKDTQATNPSQLRKPRQSSSSAAAQSPFSLTEQPHERDPTTEPA